MKIKQVVRLAGLPAVIAVTVISCGGGSGQAGAGGTGVGTAGISSGPITGFGSVFVNGVEFDTSGAKITLNGASGNQADLKVGMMVTVDGSIDADGSTGKATRIAYDDQVEGLVDSVDVANNALVVMGQTVVVDNLTVFDGTTLSGLQPGNIVAVSGMVDSSGVIHATHIELKKISFAPGDHLRIRGKVSNLDTANTVFDLGTQPVTYASAVLHGLPTGLSDGMTVQVKSTQGINADGQLVASAVEGISNDMTGAEGDEMELKGLVTAFSSLTDFSVNGQPVTATSGTRFEHGAASSITLNARVEVEGTVNAAGVLVAHKVNIEPHAAIEVSGDVQAVDPTNGTVTILGKQFTLDSNTTYRDESVTRARFFGVKDIAVGDRLDVRAYPSAGTLIATRVERKNPAAGAPVELKAAVNSVASPDLDILGINVVTDGSTSFRSGDHALTATAFFAGVAAGDVVDVQGTLTGDTVIQATLVARGD